MPRCVVSKSGPGVASAAGEGLGPELGPPEAVAGAGYLGAGRNGAARVRPEPRLRGGQSRGTAAGGCWAGDAGWGGPGAASWRHLRGPLPCIAGAGLSWPCRAQPLVGELMVKSRRGLCLLTGQQGLGTAAQRLLSPSGTTHRSPEPEKLVTVHENSFDGVLFLTEKKKSRSPLNDHATYMLCTDPGLLNIFPVRILEEDEDNRKKWGGIPFLVVVR